MSTRLEWPCLIAGEVTVPTRRLMFSRLLAVALVTPLAACAAVGPATIYQGRGLYNQVIADTSAQQTLLNLVRAHYGEVPQFLEVDGIAAAATSQISLGGNQSQIGAFSSLNTAAGIRVVSSAVGQIMSGGQFTEQPTITMKPVSGAALISQVALPITAESIVNLYDSGGSIGSIFDLAVTRFTPTFDDYHAALNALMALDRYGSIIMEARGPTELVIYYQRDRPRGQFAVCDGLPTEHPDTAVTDHLWMRLQSIFRQSGNAIVLEISSLPPPGEKKEANDQKSGTMTAKRPKLGPPPLLRTRSALGMLNTITAGDNLVVFQKKEDIDDIILGNISEQQSHCHVSFYSTKSSDLKQHISNLKYDNERFAINNGEFKGVLAPDEITKEKDYANERRLVLIEISSLPPTDAYVAVTHDGRWYSIRENDVISKRNLSLITQINTIQASASAPSSLIPTINVGARL